MGCFLGCFGTHNKGKRRKVTSRSPPRRRVQVHEVFQQTLQPIPTAVPIPEKLVEQPDAAVRAPELRNDIEQLSLTKTKKKVKFDLNVTTYGAAPVCEEETGISLDIDEQKDEVKEDRTLQKTEGHLTASSLEAYPVHHRYQYCTDSDNEISEGYEDEYGEELEDSDNDDTFNGEYQEEESYDSYFSLQREKMWPDVKEFNSAKTSNATSSDMKMKPTVAASQSARDRSQYVHSVLNPVENLSQWKEIKIKQMAPKRSKKENICLEEEQIVPYDSEQSNKSEKPRYDSTPVYMKEEVAIDASLLNWLAPRGTSHVKGSEGRQSSGSNSPTSLDDRPITGTVGSYLKHTGPITIYQRT